MRKIVVIMMVLMLCLGTTGCNMSIFKPVFTTSLIPIGETSFDELISWTGVAGGKVISDGTNKFAFFYEVNMQRPATLTRDLIVGEKVTAIRLVVAEYKDGRWNKITSTEPSDWSSPTFRKLSIIDVDNPPIYIIQNNGMCAIMAISPYTPGVGGDRANDMILATIDNGSLKIKKNIQVFSGGSLPTIDPESNSITWNIVVDYPNTPVTEYRVYFKNNDIVLDSIAKSQSLIKGLQLDYDGVLYGESYVWSAEHLY